MMALKIASLAPGASGVRPETLALLPPCSRAGLIPVVPSQGSVGASGDLAPLAHMTAAMIGEGEAFRSRASACRRAGAWRARGWRHRRSAPRKASRSSTARSSRPPTRLPGLFAAERVFQARAGHRRARDRCRQGLRHAVRPAHPGAARTSRTDRGRGRAARADGRQRHPRVASHRRRPRAGPVLPALPAAGDGRRARLLRHAASTLAIEANGVSDNPLVVRRDRRSPVRRQLPCRAGRLRRRHPGDRRLRDRLAGRAARSPCWSIPRCRGCRRS